MNFKLFKSLARNLALSFAASLSLLVFTPKVFAQCLPNAFAVGGGANMGAGFGGGFSAGGYYGPITGCNPVYSYNPGQYYSGYAGGGFDGFSSFGYGGYSPMVQPSSALGSLFNFYGSGQVRSGRSDGGSGRKSRRSRDRDDYDSGSSYGSSSYSGSNSGAEYTARLARTAQPMTPPPVYVPTPNPGRSDRGLSQLPVVPAFQATAPTRPAARVPGQPIDLLPPGVFQAEKSALEGDIKVDASRMEAGITCPTGDCAVPSPISPELIEINRRLNATHPIPQGARKAMAVIYQNCSALTTELRAGFAVDGAAGNQDGWLTRNPNRYVNQTRAVASNPYLAATPQGPQCRDRRRVYPTFHVGEGSKPKITRVGGQLSVDFNNERENGSGGNMVTTDCMGYVAASLAIAGTRLRASPNPDRAYQLGTSQLINLGTNSGEDICVDRVMFTANTSLKPGDVSVFRDPDPKSPYGHAMIFERVGPDPFGIKDISSIEQCHPKEFLKNIMVDKWDFDVMQSSSMNGRLAASRLSAQAVVTASPGVGNYLMELARRACYAKFGAKGKFEGSECSANEASACSDNKLLARVLRYKENPPLSCRDKPAKVKDEACVAGCEAIDR